MLVQPECRKSLQTMETPRLGLKDSPMLARVRRAMLRQEEEENLRNLNGTSAKSSFVQSLLSPMFDQETVHAIKRGLLWQQRDRLFSRWKERYFILTRDYLHCFRRASGSDRISEMGPILFVIKLVDVEHIQWENKKTYSTVVLNLGRGGKILLRSPDGLEDWFEILDACTLSSKERRKALRHTHDGVSRQRENNNFSPALDEWTVARRQIPSERLSTDSMSGRQDDYNFLRKRDWAPSAQDWENPDLDNRLSLLTDIDINSYDDSTLGASVTSFRLNEDILCIQPPSLRPSGSFRSNRDGISHNTVKNQVPKPSEVPCQFIRYRERSYSDIQRVDRKQPWRPSPITLADFNNCK